MAIKGKGVLSLSHIEAADALKKEYEKDCGPGTWDPIPEKLKMAMVKSYAIGYRDGITTLVEAEGGKLEVGWFDGETVQ